MRLPSIISILAAALFVGLTPIPRLHAAQAATFPLTSSDQGLVGEVRVVEATASQTLMDIARANSAGHRGIRLANPELDIWLPGQGTQIVVPGQFLLPDAPREGIVINLGEMRLYYFHSDASTNERRVTTYPIGVGRGDRPTPTGRGHVVMRLENPAWYPTAAVRADYAARGKRLPAKVAAGPDNPLGRYALVLDLPGMLIHGTNRPDGIGMRVSQGCIRLYPEHIAALVYQVPKGTAVTIVDQPIKAGVVNGQLMVEVHPAVYGSTADDAARREQELINRIVGLLEERGEELNGRVDWAWVTEVARRADGIPTAITQPEAERLLPSQARK